MSGRSGVRALRRQEGQGANGRGVAYQVVEPGDLRDDRIARPDADLLPPPFLPGWIVSPSRCRLASPMPGR